MFHVTFSVLNAVTAQQLAVAKKYNAKPSTQKEGSTVFSLHTKEFSPDDANEIVEAFDRVTIWGPNKTASSRRIGQLWECPMVEYNWTMIPGFDNSPRYNVESVELCLL